MTGLTRRRALALAGAVATAGCGALSNGDDTTTLDGAALRELVADGSPTVPERIPVNISMTHFEATETRARDLLDEVPANLGPDAIPNGAIRERVSHAREHAVEAVERAANAPSDYERLDGFADARPEARFAAASWRAIDDGLTRDDLHSDATIVREDRQALRERHEYLGADPVTALVVHAAIERRLDTHIDTNRPRRYRPGNPLGVGELAEDIERARVAVDDAEHLYDRHVASLDDSPTLRSRYRAARETLRDDFESERADLPSVDSERPWQVEGVDVSETPAAEALEELYRPLDPEYELDWAEGSLARSLVRAHRAVVDLRAFESLRARVADGERFAIESVDDVSAIRSEALRAVQSANADPSVPVLTRSILADETDRLAGVDAELADADDEERATSLRYPVSTYLTVMARARELPSASEHVASTLRT
ncbi:hypothetical protein SAMN04488065_2338 [Haloplanus vescus]|uniref:DUF885 domain-containing protein n=1 Tax=Haloplanus vescus TaxID=555874 RepID=A0A1H3ZFE4_9EURY|nr:hypothetical protein [Haloplanus vescus]SEA22476.1 hypothetical protein SAMN04488065_2338 [Haloplanus vescus]